MQNLPWCMETDSALQAIDVLAFCLPRLWYSMNMVTMMHVWWGYGRQDSWTCMILRTNEYRTLLDVSMMWACASTLHRSLWWKAPLHGCNCMVIPSGGISPARVIHKNCRPQIWCMFTWKQIPLSSVWLIHYKGVEGYYPGLFPCLTCKPLS